MDGDTVIDMKASRTITVDLSLIKSNVYNPNRMMSRETEMLDECIKKFGFLFPLITTWDEDLKMYRIIDGFHRYESLKRVGATQAVIIDMKIPYHEAVQLTVLMNKIKGIHQIELMSDLVVKLEDLGLQDSEICENLGMETEEYIRLKQQLGIAHAFKNHIYSKSWEVNEE
jgi:ParB-like chromosome segregation protein Spo0J